MRWLALALPLLGCDGLGAPVVRALPGPPASDPFMCQPSDDLCDVPFVRQVFPTPTAITPACAMPSAPCSDAKAGDCVLDLRVVAGTPVELPPQRCVALDLRPAAGSVDAELRGGSLIDTRVTVHADAPTTFVFSEADWSGVSVELSGPVSLHVEGTLRNVSIVGHGEVTIADANIVALQVALPTGQLRVQRSDLTQAHLEASEIVLETVSLDDVWAHAARLIGLELDGKMLRLDVADLSLAQLDMSQLELHACESALLLNSALSASKLGACTDVLRLHNAALQSSTVQGRIESEATYFGSTTLGPAGALTKLTMKFGTLSGNVLCPALERLEITDGTSVVCNDCASLARPEQHLCLRELSAEVAAEGPLETQPTRNTACPIFDTGLPLCGS